MRADIFRGYDKPLLFIILLLSFFGAVAVYNASTVSAYRDFGNQYHFIKDQLEYFGVGLIFMFGFSLIDYRKWYKLSIPLLVVTLILLMAVFLPGIGIHAYGAKRWLNLGLFTLQPTEMAKLALVIYLSAWFTHKEKGRFVPFLILLAVMVGLIILQPDLGTAVIISVIAGVLYFLSGAPFWHFLLLVPVVVAVVLVLALLAPYRLARITTFLNPQIDPQGTSYHIRQILIALGSGGMFGVGFGKSRQKYAYLPEANTDSIFAIIAEEVGFIGTAFLVLGFMYLILRAFQLARRAPDKFGQLLGSGIAAWLAFQVLINLASMVALIPLTGVPLPFISYGGSSLVSLFMGLGILLNIGKHGQKGQPSSGVY